MLKKIGLTLVLVLGIHSILLLSAFWIDCIAETGGADGFGVFIVYYAPFIIFACVSVVILIKHLFKKQ